MKYVLGPSLEFGGWCYVSFVFDIEEIDNEIEK